MKFKRNKTLDETVVSPSSSTPTNTSSSSTSSSKKRPSSVNSDFDVSNYAIVFEEMMDSKETRDLFYEYLQLNRSVESLMFMNQVEEYRAEYNKKFENVICGENVDKKQVHAKIIEIYSKARGILDQFVFQGGQFELNLAFANKDKIRELWETKVCESFEKLDKERLEVEKLSKIISMLETDTLFGLAMFSVNLDLRFDQFPRFSRSEMLMKFLESKGERFTRAIATDISKGFQLDIRFKPHHLQDSTIDDKFIYFGFTLAEDTPDWELTYSDKKNTCELYQSKTSYVFDTETLKGLRLSKVVTRVPYPIEEVWACFWNIDLHKVIDPMGGAETFKLMDYISPVSEAEGKPNYSNQQVSCCTKFPIPFMKKRDLPITMTAIRDPELNMIMVAGHTCSLIETREDCIPAQLMFYYMFYKVSDNETRFIHTVYTDLKLPLNPSLMLKVIMLKRAKDYKKGFEQQITRLRKEKSTKDGLMDTSQFVDAMKYNLAIEENTKLYPNRSWYNEWLQLREKRLSLNMSDAKSN